MAYYAKKKTEPKIKNPYIYEPEKKLKATDPQLYKAIKKELKREQEHLELIASENIVSRAVLEAQGSIMTNKYAEGYPGRRYYGGCEFVDIAEQLAIDRAKILFDCSFANVQTHSGSQANQAVMLALLNPGDCFMGMSMNSGGHLTHGANVNLSGKWFKAVQYGVDKKTHLIDYDEVETLAREHKPKIIIAGGSAYPRQIDFKKFRKIADDIGAYFWVDMAHFAGLVAAGAHPNPLDHAHVVTSTTHKTLRGPRGGLILSRDPELGKKINSAVFPGLQGGPLMHVIAAKAVAFGEALSDEYKSYIHQVVKNAKIMAQTFIKNGLDIVSGGTDTHLMLVDLRPKKVTGVEVERLLGHVNITLNKNGIPFDPEKPTITSGIRIGTPAITTRGFKEEDAVKTAELVLKGIEMTASQNEDPKELEKLQKKVIKLCEKFPIYDYLT